MNKGDINSRDIQEVELSGLGNLLIQGWVITRLARANNNNDGG